MARVAALPRFLSVALFLSALALGSGCGNSACEDGVDNDGDGVIDGDDPGCAFNGDSEAPDPPACNDGIDNDGDGLVDGRDPGCENSLDEDESNEPIAACKDGVDNDSDGLVDFPADPGCSLSADDDESDDCPSGPDCPQCSNGIDDDGDGVIDYPDELGCNSAGDPDEFNADPSICGGSVPLSLLPGDGIAVGAFSDTGQNNLNSLECGGEGTEVVFQFDVTETQTLVFSTDFPETTTDTVIYVRSMCRDTDTELDCNDDFGEGTKSRLTIEDMAPGTYYIVVDTRSTPGDFKLQVGTPEEVPLNLCPAETDPLVPVDAATLTGTTQGATAAVLPVCGSQTGPDRIFQLEVPGELATLDIDSLGSSFDTVLDVRSGTCTGTSIGCNDDGGTDSTSLVSLTDVAAGTYFIVLDGFFGAAGDYVLNVAGTIKTGQPCSPTAESAGYLTCVAGSTCQGTTGSETCQAN